MFIVIINFHARCTAALHTLHLVLSDPTIPSIVEQRNTSAYTSAVNHIPSNVAFIVMSAVEAEDEDTYYEQVKNG